MSLGHAHNYYLNVAAETGLLGLGAYLTLWGTAFARVWLGLRRAGSTWMRVTSLAALGVLVHVSVHNVVDNLWVHNLYIQVAVLLGLAENAARDRSEQH
jgi:O-antigen ligase